MNPGLTLTSTSYTSRKPAMAFSHTFLHITACHRAAVIRSHMTDGHSVTGLVPARDSIMRKPHQSNLVQFSVVKLVTRP